MAKGFTAKEKVLVHLLEYYDSRDKYPQPVEVTQEGIADSIGSKQNTVSYAVRNLVKDGYLYEKTTRIRSKRQRRKGYFLTEKGVEEAEEIRRDMLHTPVQVILNEEEKEILLKDINKYFHTNFSIIELVKEVEDGEFKLDASKQDEIYVSYLDDIPKPPDIDFKEERQMDKWWENGDDLLVVKGDEGYGKTALLSSYLNKMMGGASVFYYKMRDWHIDRNFFLDFTQYLSDAGEHKLSSYIEATTTIDFYEALSNLKRDIQLIPDPLLVIDDIDKNREMWEILKKIIDDILQSTSIKIILTTSEDLNSLGLKNDYSLIDLEEKRDDNPYLNSIKNYFDVPEDSSLIEEVIEYHLTSEEFLALAYISVFRKPVERHEITTLETVNRNILNNLLNTPLLDLTSKDKPIIHDILREKLLDNLSKRDLRLLNDMASEYYNNLPAKTEVEKIEMIYHLTESKNIERLTDELEEYGSEIVSSGYAKSLLKILQNLDIGPEFHRTDEIVNYMKAECHRVLNNTEEAVEKYEYVMERTEDKKMVTKLHHGLAMVKEEMGDIEESLKEYKEAVDLAEDLGERGDILLGETYLKLGKLHNNEGNYDEAIDYLERAIDIFNEKDLFSSLTNSYFLLARIEKSQGNWEEALNYFKDGIEYWKQINESYQRVGGLHEIGSFYKVIRELKNAEEFLIETVQTCEKFGYRHLKASALVTLSEVYLEKGEYEESIESAAWAGEIFDVLGKEEEEAYTYALVGQAYMKLNMDGKAEEYLNKAITIYQKLGVSYSLGLTYFSMAKLQEKKGNREGIADNYRKALLSLTSSGADRMAKRVKKELSTVPLSM